MGGDRTGIFLLPRRDMTNADGVAYARRMGCRAFEPSASAELAEPDIRAAKLLGKAASDAGVALPCLSVGADLTGAGGDAAAARLMGFVDAAAAMGAPRMLHTVAPCLTPGAASMEETLAEVIPRMRRVFDYGASRGVDVVYEEQGLLFNGVRGFSAMLEALARPAGVVLDMGNMAFVGEDPLRFAQCFLNRIVHVHVKDYARAPSGDGGYPLADGTRLIPAILGEGDMRCREALALLGEVGYAGNLTLEHETRFDGEAEQRRCLDFLRRAL